MYKREKQYSIETRVEKKNPLPAKRKYQQFQSNTNQSRKHFCHVTKPEWIPSSGINLKIQFSSRAHRSRFTCITSAKLSIPTGL